MTKNGTTTCPRPVHDEQPSVSHSPHGLLRCELEPLEEPEAASGERALADTVNPTIVAEFEITNRDVTRRRFQVRATRTDQVCRVVGFAAHDTQPLAPLESSLETIRFGAADIDVPPHACSAKV